MTLQFTGHHFNPRMIKQVNLSSIQLDKDDQMSERNQMNKKPTKNKNVKKKPPKIEKRNKMSKTKGKENQPVKKNILVTASQDKKKNTLTLSFDHRLKQAEIMKMLTESDSDKKLFSFSEKLDTQFSSIPRDDLASTGYKESLTAGSSDYDPEYIYTKMVVTSRQQFVKIDDVKSQITIDYKGLPKNDEKMYRSIIEKLIDSYG